MDSKFSNELVKNQKKYIMKFLSGFQDLDVFNAIFDKCGIYELMKTLGISEITPAMCAYDYGMAKLTGSEFTRKYTLASGGPVCDCHYKKKILK